MFVRLERCAGKLARTVLRGESGGNVTLLPDNPADPQSYNRYSYVRNNPLTRIDPSGHFDIACPDLCSDVPGAPGPETPEECVIHPAQCGYVEDQDPYPGLPTVTSESHEFATPFSLDSVTRMRGLQWDEAGDLSHNGVDYSANTGTNIAASGVGVVVIVDYCTLQPTCVQQSDNESAPVNGGFGTVVIVEYGYDSLSDEVRAAYKLKPGQSLYVLYGHLSSIDVRRGDVVTAGTVIGQMGNTGNSGGSHLHAEFRTGVSGQIWSSSLCTGSGRCTGQPTWSTWYGLEVVDPEAVWN